MFGIGVGDYAILPINLFIFLTKNLDLKRAPLLKRSAQPLLLQGWIGFIEMA